MKRTLITGITGQDGSYLTEFLLAKGYEVHGIIRRASTFNTDRIDHLYEDPHTSTARLFLHYGDLSDGPGLRRILEQVQPDELSCTGFDGGSLLTQPASAGLAGDCNLPRTQWGSGNRELSAGVDG